MDSVSLDAADRGLLHALQLDGRAPFSRIGAVLDISERTLARRYSRLRGTGALRITGGLDGRVGQTEWLVRLRMNPGGTAELARVLARRADTAWVTIMSSGTEIFCLFRLAEAPLPELARHPKVLAVEAHQLLRQFMDRRWQGRTSALSAEQIAALRMPAAADPTPIVMTDLDNRLLPVLAVDGRAAYPSLARAVGWSESAVRRRLDELRRASVVRFDVEIDPALFGFTVQSLLWLTVAPGRLGAVAQTIAADPEAAFVAATTGIHNLLAIVVCRDIESLYSYTADRVGALDGVERMEVTPISGYSKRTAPIHGPTPGR